MNEKFKNQERSHDDDEVTARLMRIAGRRADVPADVESRVYERVLDEWTAASSDVPSYKSAVRGWRRERLRTQLLRWGAPILVAATAAFVVIFMSQPPPPAIPAVGTIAMISGESIQQDYSLGQEVSVGATITTQNGQGISLSLARNESLRLGENSQLRIDDGNQFVLLKGRVYADTGQYMYRDGGLIITAGFATVTDVGTQFAVAFDGTSVDVAVREGRVDVDRASGALVAVAGERLRIMVTGDAISEEITPRAEFWDWASSLAPEYEIEGKSLMEFLNWAARETGLQLVFANNELRMAAMRTDLHGTVAGFSPAQAIAAVLQTTSFVFRVDAGTIYIDG